MTAHQGKKLERILVLMDKKPDDLAKILGVSVPTLYRWMKKDRLPNDKILLLKSIRVDLDKPLSPAPSITNTLTQNQYGAGYSPQEQQYIDLFACKQKVEFLEKQITLLAEMNEMLKQEKTRLIDLLEKK
jgi:transcriptional regulator with XRE-family HTH domain